jgi:hypothetical protein
VKLLVDMNLSPSWVDRLAHHKFQAVHWSTIRVPGFVGQMPAPVLHLGDLRIGLVRMQPTR